MIYGNTMFDRLRAVAPEQRLAAFESYRSALDALLQKPAVYDALGPTNHADLTAMISRVTVAKLTETGSIELWPGSAPDAVAVMPVLPRERTTGWNVGNSIVEVLSPASRALVTKYDLRTSPQSEDEPNPYAPDGRLYRKTYAFPVPPRREASAEVITGSHIYTDGVEEYSLHSQPVVILSAQRTDAAKAALLGHELRHVVQRDNRNLSPYIKLLTKSRVVQGCFNEAEGYLDGAAIMSGATTAERVAIEISSISHLHSAKRAKEIRSWQQCAEETGDIRYLTANMYQHGMYSLPEEHVSQLPPEDRDCLTLPK